MFDTNAEKKESETWWPRASDEVQKIEKDIGPVRMVTTITPAKIEYRISDELIQGDNPIFGVVEKK